MDVNGENDGENGEKGEGWKTNFEPFNVTLVTVEDLDSSDVTLVHFNATLVTVENFESYNVTLGSEGKNIMGTNLNSMEEIETNEKKYEITGFETFYATLVTVEKFESSNVTLVNSDLTLVTIGSFESSNVTLVSEDKNILGAHHTKNS